MPQKGRKRNRNERLKNEIIEETTPVTCPAAKNSNKKPMS